MQVEEIRLHRFIIKIRISLCKESVEDYKQISYVDDPAFGQKNEGELIKKLRKRKEFISDLSIVAVYEEMLTGHILFFPIQIKDITQVFPLLSLVIIITSLSPQRLIGIKGNLLFPVEFNEIL